MVIKIGLLLDSWQVPAWQQLIITYIRNHRSLSIDLVILNDAQRKRSYGNLVYKFFRRIDRKLFSSRNDCFDRIDIEELLQGIEVKNTLPYHAAYTDEFLQHDLDFIESKELDILIRFGFRILKGGILTAARYGVWSLHHGDNAVNRGGPPAFWEVVNNALVTGVTLQVLSNELDGGIVIARSFIKTDRTSFNRNQNSLYWAGIELFCAALQELSEKGNAAHRKELGFYSNPLYRNPGNAQAMVIFLEFWIRRFREAMRSVIKKQQWSLYYKFKSGSSFENSLFRYRQLTPPTGTDWADPFVVFKDNTYYVFLEEYFYPNKKAHISYLEFDNTGEVKSITPVKIVEEQFHLSYPFVFEYGDTYYMVPESAECNSVWIYTCEKFPGQWKKHSELLKDVTLYDPTILLHNNMWYLFGTQKPLEGNSPHQYLYIYYAQDLFSGHWQSHPQNPVTRDVRGARPAGRIFEHNGELIRPAQIGAPKYGYGIRFQKIVRLTPEVYEERPMDDILPNWRKGLLATHTFNHDNGFSVVDGQM